MTATTSTVSSNNQHRFAIEPRPPQMAKRRDERIKCFSSFDDITESEEEDIQEPTSSNSSTTSERSPYAVYDANEKLTSILTQAKMRSFSLTNNPFLSPKAIRQILPNKTPRLSRGFSDPVVRRKTSLPTFLTGYHSPDSHSDDFLGLPPIPEATTPASPSATSAQSTNPFKRNEN